MIKLHLYEGKKQAKQILGDLANEHYLGMSVLDHLLAEDPTPTNKYVEVYARWFKKEYLDGIKQGWEPKALIQHTIDYFYKNLPEGWQDLILQAEKKGFNADVSKISSLSELETLLKKTALKITRSAKKFGVAGLTLGEDYEILYENDVMWAIQPFSWEASKVLASSYVGHCEGEWCIAYQKTKYYWDKYTTENGEAPVFMIMKNENEDDESLKYSFMYGDDYYNIWNAEDLQVTSGKEDVLIKLGIDKNINKTLWEKARENALEKIEGFSEGGENEERIFDAYYEVNTKNRDDTGYLGDVVGRVSIEVRTWRGNNYDDTDIDTEEYDNTEGELYLGNKFFTNEGYTVLEQLYNQGEFEYGNDFIEDSLVIIYDNKSFGTIYDEMERYQYDDINFDYSTYSVKSILEKYNVASVVILAPVDIKDIYEEPFVETFRDIRGHSKDNYETYEIDNIGMNNQTYSMSYITRNETSIMEYIESHPKLSQIITGWKRDDEREKEMGQQFLQFEHTNLMKFLKQYKANLKG